MFTFCVWQLLTCCHRYLLLFVVVVVCYFRCCLYFLNFFPAAVSFNCLFFGWPGKMVTIFFRRFRCNWIQYIFSNKKLQINDKHTVLQRNPKRVNVETRLMKKIMLSVGAGLIDWAYFIHIAFCPRTSFCAYQLAFRQQVHLPVMSMAFKSFWSQNAVLAFAPGFGTAVYNNRLCLCVYMVWFWAGCGKDMSYGWCWFQCCEWNASVCVLLGLLFIVNMCLNAWCIDIRCLSVCVYCYIFIYACGMHIFISI